MHTKISVIQKKKIKILSDKTKIKVDRCWKLCGKYFLRISALNNMYNLDLYLRRWGSAACYKNLLLSFLTLFVPGEGRRQIVLFLVILI